MDEGSCVAGGPVPLRSDPWLRRRHSDSEDTLKYILKHVRQHEALKKQDTVKAK